jgi:voltage-gated potassium channel
METRNSRFVRLVNSPLHLAAFGGAVVLIAGVVYAIAERASVADSIYWSFVTATTLGYGDLSPSTEVAKVTSVVLVVFTVLFYLPMITASMASRLIVNRDAFTHEEQEEIKVMLRALVARQRDSGQ